MEIQSSQFTVNDYCNMHERREVRVDARYQRSEKVWPRPAQTFLIETILLGFPIPKLFLHIKTDIKTRQTTRFVVDGQQRTRAIVEFAADKYRLSRNLDGVPEAAGKKFSQLDEDLQGRFLTYGLNFDVFVTATDEEVREVFRRMNSFTVPLNAEERRHAVYQGPFKWFANSITSDFDGFFINAGTFSANQLVRMQDAKLITELATAYFRGITTTKASDLDRTYRERNTGDSFEGQEDLNRRLRHAIEFIMSLEDLYGATLLKRTHVLYSLLLATMHLQEPVHALIPDEPEPGLTLAAAPEILVNLSRLSEALAIEDEQEVDEPIRPFVIASRSKTNVDTQRVTRFRTLCCALADCLP